MRLPRCLPSGLTTQGSGVRGRRAKAVVSPESMQGPESAAADCQAAGAHQAVAGPTACPSERPKDEIRSANPAPPASGVRRGGRH